ncbi:restriction endonuclease subunit S [Tenacibaculum finnmarkense]|uniref:restriction endonuclease subunit S n=1 Tax=Tenacibaculum finnmarkense TaxID=2781243 RepID=UPI001EFA93A6|nr:restriction endonuclease subunit S [Tenacibaculum finnmarkense]
MEIITKNNIKKYSTYKNSGVEWLGEIPEHWEVKKFKHIFKEKKITHNIKLNCGSISFGKVVFKDDEKVPISTKKSYQVLNKGEFLINPLNLNYDLISLRIALSDKDVVVSSGYIIIQNITELSKNYYKWLLHIFDVTYMKTLGSGVRQTLSFTHVTNSKLVVPPLSEQTKIAEFLDDKTKKIDEAIAIKTQQINLLKERKQILIHKAVTRGLDTNVKLKNSGVEWIGEIPVGWETIKLAILIEKYDLGVDYNSSFISDGIPIIKMGNIGRGKIDLKKIEYLQINKKINSKILLNENDFLFNTRNSYELVGKVTLWRNELPKATFNLNILRIKFTKIIDVFFMNFIFNSERTLSVLKLISKGTTNVSAIYFKDLSKLKFPIPPLSEQKEISSYIEKSSEKIATAIGLKSEEIEKLKEYKSSLINSVVTGKVRVC